MTTTVTPDHAQRPVSGHLNYRGDHRHLVGDTTLHTTPAGHHGPPPWVNDYMELVYPVEATYDPDTDTTRVGVTTIHPIPTPAPQAPTAGASGAGGKVASGGSMATIDLSSIQ